MVTSREMKAADVKAALKRMKDRLEFTTDLCEKIKNYNFADYFTDTMGIVPWEKVGEDLDYYRRNSAFWGDRPELSEAHESLDGECLVKKTQSSYITLFSDSDVIEQAFEYERRQCDTIVKYLEKELAEKQATEMAKSTKADYTFKVDRSVVKYIEESLKYGRGASDLAPGEIGEVFCEDIGEIEFSVSLINRGEKHQLKCDLSCFFCMADDKPTPPKIVSYPKDTLVGEYKFTDKKGKLFTVILEAATA